MTKKEVVFMFISAITTFVIGLENLESKFCNKENIDCNVIESDNSFDDKVCDSSLFSKEAISAIQRAKSSECKAKLTKIACIGDDLYPKEIKSKCDFYQKVGYLGCFQDSYKQRLFKGAKRQFDGFNNPYECTKFCAQNGYSLAGLQMGFGCACDNNIDMSKKIDEDHCNMPCNDGSNLICGGKITMNVYKVSLEFGFNIFRLHRLKYVSDECVS